MNGQVSLDFLVVSLIALSVLAVWFAGAMQAQNAVLTAIHTQAAHSQADLLRATFDSLCVMGKGNTAQVKVHHDAVVHNTLCPIQKHNFSAGEHFTAKNTGDKITFQPQSAP